MKSQDIIIIMKQLYIKISYYKNSFSGNSPVSSAFLIDHTGFKHESQLYSSILIGIYRNIVI